METQEPNFDEKDLSQSWMMFIHAILKAFVDMNITDFMDCSGIPLHLLIKTEDITFSLRPHQLESYHYEILSQKIIETQPPAMKAERVMRNNEPVQFRIFLKYWNVKLNQPRATMMRGTLQNYEKEIMKLIQSYMCKYGSAANSPLPEEDFRPFLEGWKEELCDLNK